MDHPPKRKPRRRWQRPPKPRPTAAEVKLALDFLAPPPRPKPEPDENAVERGNVDMRGGA